MRRSWRRRSRNGHLIYLVSDVRGRSRSRRRSRASFLAHLGFSYGPGLPLFTDTTGVGRLPAALCLELPPRNCVPAGKSSFRSTPTEGPVLVVWYWPECLAVAPPLRGFRSLLCHMSTTPWRHCSPATHSIQTSRSLGNRSGALSAELVPSGRFRTVRLPHHVRRKRGVRGVPRRAPREDQSRHGCFQR